MSFYSYKNADTACSPGVVNGNILTGLNQRVCLQVKNVYDSCLSQEQLDKKQITITNIVPVLPGSDCRPSGSKQCRCTCDENRCKCTCPTCGAGVTHEEAVENAENSPCPLPQPCGQWTFESCRSSTTRGNITNLCIERLCDRPQFARVKCTIDVPIDVLFVDQRCQEWMGQATLSVDRDVLLCIPDDSILPFTLESLASAICVSGNYIGNCTFEITICVTVVLKVLAEVDIMVPTYGFCQVPPAEEFAESVCDESRHRSYLFYFHPSIRDFTSAVLAIRSLWIDSHAASMPLAYSGLRLYSSLALCASISFLMAAWPLALNPMCALAISRYQAAASGASALSS